MKLIHTLSIALLAVAAILLGACNKTYEPDGPNGGEGKLQLRFGAEDLVQRDTRGIATPAENHVDKVDVVFFQGQNKKPITPNSGGAAAGYFHFESGQVGDWLNNDPSTQTVYLPVKAADVNGLTAITLLNLPDAVRSRLAVGATDEITTLDQLQKAVSQTIATVNDLSTPLLMTGTKAVNFTNPNTQDNKIEVSVKRAVSRFDVVLYYNWDKLIPNQQKGLYTYKDFPGKTYVGVNDDITSRVDGAKTQIADLTAQPAPLTPADPVPTSALPTVYVNEYDITGKTPADAPAPYILLELPAKLGDGNPLAGIFPPPAGGDFSNDAVKCYYKVLLPRKIDRNCRYVLHAHVVGPGSPSPDNAVVLEFKMTVMKWNAVTVPGYYGDDQIVKRL